MAKKNGKANGKANGKSTLAADVERVRAAGLTGEPVETDVDDLIGDAAPMPAPLVDAPKRFRYLKCVLTEDEIRERGEEVAAVLGLADSAEAEVDALKDEAKLKQKSVDVLVAKSRAISRAIRDGYEHREVECTERQGANEDGVIGMLTERVDTGETIDWRPFESHERQGALFA